MKPEAFCVSNNLATASAIKPLTIFGRERQPQLHKKIEITEIKAVKLCRNHNSKDLLSE